MFTQPQHPGVNPEPEGDIQLHGAKFDQQEVISGTEVYDPFTGLRGRYIS
tara:strand:- start:66 stop:215 length:150 start_codon:yes stop_codon:yes gene_type:complete